MTFDDLFGDVEAKTQTSIVGRRHLPAPMEAFEHLIQLVDRNADSVVADARHELIALLLDADSDLTAVRRVLHGVLHQVAQDLLETIAVAIHHPSIFSDVELEGTVAEGRVVTANHFTDEGRPDDRLAANLEPAGLNPPDIQKLQDQPR